MPHKLSVRNRKWLSILLIAAMVLQVVSFWQAPGVVYADEQQASGAIPEAYSSMPEQSGGLNKWYVTGSFQGWNNTNEETRMKRLVGGFYFLQYNLQAGSYEFKFTKNGTWDGYSDNGNNIVFSLAEPTAVGFYVNEEIGQARISLPGVQSVPQYVPAKSDSEWPRLVGDIQSVFGENEWAPDAAGQYFVDYYFDGSVYKLERTIPAGQYEAKVTFGPSWAENYGATGREGGNLVLNTLDPAEVTFSINYTGDQQLSHNYKPSDGGSDGLIKSSKLYFDSRDIIYKKPFGAIPMGEQALTLRFAAEKDDVTLAKVDLISPDSLAHSFEMRKITSIAEHDFFEVVIPADVFDQIGIWGYKFILIDGATKMEYGDDGIRGRTGAAAEDGALPYELTVYAPDFKTPDWMKDAVVYQIFPDRFFDGNEENNRAKLLDGYRGVRNDAVSGGEIKRQPLQYFDGGVANDPAPEQVKGDWSSIPENPDRLKPENKPYFPGSETDGVWTNEFYGGDIQGIHQKLDYLESIGVTAIYLNPVAWAASNHKYDATDYKHLDPMFGEPVYNIPGDPTSGLDYDKTREASDQVYSAFAKAAKERGIRLINDGVFNHVGDDSIYFDRYEKYPEIGAYEYWARVWNKVNDEGKTREQAEQEVRDYFMGQINPATGTNYKYPEDFVYTTWFTVLNEKVYDRDRKTMIYKYDAWWGYDSLPVMDAMEPQPGDPDALEGQHEWNNVTFRDQVLGKPLTGLTENEQQDRMQNTVSQRWEWLGGSGWRLDVAPDVSLGTWKKFRESVKSVEGLTDANGNPIDEPIILGEEWGVATHFLLGDQFDSVMNYRFRAALQSFLIGGNAAAMNEALESIREDYPKEAWQVMLNLVGSHDTTRNVTKLDYPQWEEENLAIAPEASDEALKQQALTAIFQMGYPGAPTIYYGDEVAVAGTKDPDSRRTFPWERVSEENGQFRGEGRFADLFQVYQQAAAIRHQNEVFRTGELFTAYAEGDVIAYARKNDSKAGLVAINRSSTEQVIEADVTGFLPDGITLVDQLYGEASAVVVNGKLELTLPAMTGLMMVSDGTFTLVPEVTGLTAVGGNGAVSLEWQPVDGAEGYTVYRAYIEGGPLTKLGQVQETSFVDPTVVNGTKYYYAVAANIGTGESLLGSMAAATPAFPIGAIGEPSPVQNVTLGVGKTTDSIVVSVAVPGLTDDPAYTGQGVPGIITRLAYYKQGSDPAKASDTRLRYKEDGQDGDKLYYASFEPTEVGEYLYYAKVSTDNGDTWTLSAHVSVTVLADESDVEAPAAPALLDILEESNRVELQWTVDQADQDIKGFEIYRKASHESAFRLIGRTGADARSYIDYAVSNDTAYTYHVAAFDGAYNRGYSEDKSVTPKLVMVDVTLRVHLPDYTPATDSIYIAGGFNGWNSSGNQLHVPSGATNRDVVEYSFKMMAGRQIEYKYTRGTWSTEAFASHRRVPNDREDHGNWAYSSTDTNMKLTIKNMGGNKMLVNDYILRWVDMPMMVSMPRKSFGEDIVYTTTDSSFKLKANVPYGVTFTINDQPLPQGAMDGYGNVELEEIPLAPGVNTFVLHIEPTAETLSLPWYTDKGRAGQATKTITMTITREGGVVEPTPTATTPPVEPTPTATTPPVEPTPTATTPPEEPTPTATTPPEEPTPTATTPPVEPTPTATTPPVEPTPTATTPPVVSTPAPTVKPTEKPPVASGPVGEITKDTTSEGESLVSVKVSNEKLEKALDDLKGKPAVDQRLVVKVEDQSAVQFTMGAGTLLQVAQDLPDAVLVFENLSAGYELPVALSRQGLEAMAASQGLALKDLQLIIRIEPADKQQAAGMQAFASAQGMETVIPGMEFSVWLQAGATKQEWNNFGQLYITRTIKMPAGFTSENAIGVMWDPVTGKLMYVPTTFQQKDGQLQAELKRNGNSVYTVVKFTKSFMDMKGHWAQPVVEGMASKLLLQGRTTETFAPEDRITRGEFAALLIRALGLPESKAGATSLTDVPADAWYAGAVVAAVEAKLMTGYGDGTFRPMASITRQEVAVLMARAAAFAGKGTSGSNPDLSATFGDYQEIADWAAESVIRSVEAGLIQGNEKGMFAPKAFTTRAEAAVMLHRLLGYVGFIQK